MGKKLQERISSLVLTSGRSWVFTNSSRIKSLGKQVKIELYKLAVYKKDGHFDWHRDTTHGDDHHATVLVTLNTEWKGGNLGLRHQGTSVDVDLHPVRKEVKDKNYMEVYEGKEEGVRGSRAKCSLGFQIIAFYTDIEHKVEKTTDGTRIILQFDVNVKGGQDDYSEDTLKSNHEVDDDDDSSLAGSDLLDTLKPIFPVSGTDKSRNANLEQLIGMVKREHASKVDEVVLPLRHLYRMACIKPGYLKGVDGYLYEGLKNHSKSA
jgi:2OG-Fe(II) oxygenase superfamily